MSARFRRYTPALVLALAALAVAGCGGSSKSSGSSGNSGGSGATSTAAGPALTPKEWQAKMQSISSDLTSAFQPVRSQGRDPATWFTLAATLRHINSEVASLKPPPVANGVNAAIVSGLAPLPNEAQAIGTDLKNQNQSAAKSDAVALEKSLFSLLNKISAALLKLHGGTTTK